MDQDYFPNNWDRINQLEEHHFKAKGFTTVLQTAGSWMLPETTAGVIRIENEDGTIRELTVETMDKFNRMISIVENRQLPYTAYDAETMDRNYCIIGDDES